jgi:hypothetical protein
MGFRTGLDVSEKRKIYTGNRTAILSIVQSLALSASLFIYLKQIKCAVADRMYLKGGVFKPDNELGLLKKASRFLE